MRPEFDSLSTPWLREQLVEHLEHLADQRWLDAALGGGGESLDQMLDFFDDSGVLDDPEARIGFVLLDDAEADLLARLGMELDEVLEGRAAGGAQASTSWQSVRSAARAALGQLRTRGGSGC